MMMFGWAAAVQTRTAGAGAFQAGAGAAGWCDPTGLAVLSVGWSKVLPGVAECDARSSTAVKEIVMARFLVTYHGLGAPAPDQIEQAKAAFGAWLAQAGAAVVDPGAPLQPAGAVGEQAEAVSISGYSMLEAESVDAVKALLASHPYVARGGTLQVHEAVAV